MSDRMPIEERIHIFQAWNAELKADPALAGTPRQTALEDHLPISIWTAEHQLALQLGNAIEARDLVAEVQTALAHTDAFRKWARDIEAAERSAELAMVDERFPGAEIVGLGDADDHDDTDTATGQMEVLSP